MAEEFAQSFNDADKVVLAEIYSAGEKPIEGVSSQLILDSMPKGIDVRYIKDREDIINYLEKTVEPGDIVLTLGAGNVWSIGVDLVERLKKQNSRATL